MEEEMQYRLNGKTARQLQATAIRYNLMSGNDEWRLMPRSVIAKYSEEEGERGSGKSCAFSTSYALISMIMVLCLQTSFTSRITLAKWLTDRWNDRAK